MNTEVDYSRVRVRDSIIIGRTETAAGFVCFAGSIFIAGAKKPSPEQLRAWDGQLGITWAEPAELFLLKDEQE